METFERDQFTFYVSYAKAISRIKKATDRCAAYDAIVNYALYGTLPDIDELPEAIAIVFELCKPTLDNGRKKASNRKSEREKQNEDLSRPLGETKSSLIFPVGETKTDFDSPTGRKEKEGEREEEREKEKEKEKKEKENADKPPRFVPPTVEEVAAYCQERNNGIDAASFVDFYQSKNWKVGKDKMSDWKASVRTWERRRKEERGGLDRVSGKPEAKKFELVYDA